MTRFSKALMTASMVFAVVCLLVMVQELSLITNSNTLVLSRINQ